MSDNKFNDDGTFTEDYKTEMLLHPALSNITQLLITIHKTDEEIDAIKISEEFLKELENSSSYFFSLKAEAFSQAEIVQHGLHMLNCMMYQFFPRLSEKVALTDFYAEINKVFWGNYFLLVGDETSQRLSSTYDISAIDAAKRFALEFWRFGEETFPETIACGYHFLSDERMLEKYLKRDA
jgi:hypothetical protein